VAGVPAAEAVRGVGDRDADDYGGRAAVVGDDHVIPLGEVDALPDLVLQVADGDGFHRMASVVAVASSPGCPFAPLSTGAWFATL